MIGALLFLEKIKIIHCMSFTEFVRAIDGKGEFREERIYNDLQIGVMQGLMALTHAELINLHTYVEKSQPYTNLKNLLDCINDFPALTKNFPS